MKKNINKIIITLVVIMISFFVGVRNIKAYTVDNNCSRYFTIKEVNYEERKSFNSMYNKGKLKSGHFINGKSVTTSGYPWTNTATNTTAWYYRTVGDKDLSSNAKLTITVYNNKNSNICTTNISGFKTKNKDHIKVVLNHTGKDQWVKVKGYFTDGSNMSSSAVASDIKIDTKKVLVSHSEEKVGTNGSGGTIVETTVTATDPNDWGKYDSYKLNSVKLKTDGASTTLKKHDDYVVSKSTFDDCMDDENEDKKCERAKIVVRIYGGEKSNSNKEYSLNFTFVKKSGVKTNATVTFSVDGKELITTARITKKGSDGKIYDENGNEMCDDGTYKSKNGCSFDKKKGASSGTRKGNSKKVELKTNSDGEIVNSSSTSCTEVSDLIHDYWKYVMVIVPILLIVMMTIDFFKALAKGDSDSIKKAGNNTVKRTIAAVVLLALPALLGLIFSWFGLELCI